jgi:hypothetical protein
MMLDQHRRGRSDSGVTMIEAAFVLPIVLLVFFAIIEFGLLFAAVSTTSSSSRAGARFGSANFAVAADRQTAANEVRDEVMSSLSARTGLDTPQLLWVYSATSTGTPEGGSFDSCTSNCFRYVWNNATKTFDTDGGTWPLPDACGATLDSLGVYLQVDHALVSGFFARNRLVKEHTVNRLEPIPAEQCPAGAT